MVLEFASPRFAGDPLLVAILNDPDTGTMKLEAGSPPDSVRTLQTALFDLTWNRKTSQPLILERSEFVVGIYGPKTTESVKAFKTRFGIHFPPDDPAGFVDGLAGPRTLAQLDRCCVVLDAFIAAIEAKAAALIASGIDVTINTSELRTLPIDNTSGTFTPAHIGGVSGAIFFTRGHGEANEVHGNIYDAYLPTFANGPLGFPITDEEDIIDQPGFRASHFDNGRLRCDLSTGVVDQLLIPNLPPDPDPVF